MVRVVGAAFGVLTLWLTFRGADTGRVASILGQLGAMSLVILIPAVGAVVLETISWRMAFTWLGARVPFVALLRVRVATESLAIALPLGALWSETVKPYLLYRDCGVPLSQALVGLAARKYLLLLSQGAYLIIGFGAGLATLRLGFAQAGGSEWLALSALVLGVAFGFAAEILARVLGGGAVFGFVVSLLRRIPSSTFRAWLETRREELGRTDWDASRFFGLPFSKRVLASLPCLGSWLLEAAETWAILTVLGADVGFGGAIGIEALVVLARQVLVFLPGGLGVQEAGYVALLAGIGIELELTIAFLVVKRAKELLWVIVGYCLLPGQRRPGRVTTSAPGVGNKPRLRESPANRAEPRPA